MNTDLEKDRNYDGFLVGTIFAIVSFLLTLTFVVPIISVFQGVLAELVIKALVDNDPYSNVGKGTIVLLTFVLTITFAIVLFRIRQITIREGGISKTKIALYMSSLYFIVHALGFYVYWGMSLEFRGDGQLIFAAVDSFPFSSWAFIPIGLIIDLVKNANSTSD